MTGKELNLTGQQLKRMIEVCLCDIEFYFNNIHGCICPFARDDIAFKHGDFEKDYTCIDDLMNDLIFNGKSLIDVTPEIDFDETTLMEYDTITAGTKE